MRLSPSSPEEAAPRRRRERLAPDVRRAAILEAAAAQSLEGGVLPLSPEALARQLGVSKALIYSYFPTQYDLLNALLLVCLDELETAGLDQALAGSSADKVAHAAGLLYFDHVLQRGPLLHLVMDDLYMAGHLSREVQARRDRVYRRLARLVRRDLRLDAEAGLVAINLVMTIPEEAGRRVRLGQLEADVGRAVCAELLASAIRGLTPDRAKGA